MLTCKEVSQLVSELLDRQLPLWQRVQVRMHLFMCRFCSRFRKQTLFLRAAARHYLSAVEMTENGSGTALSLEASNRIKKSLKT